MTDSKPPELPVRLFMDDAAWEAWLAKQHAKSAGLWLRIAKAASNVTSVSYADALDIALCYGWIDGKKKTFDDAGASQWKWKLPCSRLSLSFGMFPLELFSTAATM